MSAPRLLGEAAWPKSVLAEAIRVGRWPLERQEQWNSFATFTGR